MTIRTLGIVASGAPSLSALQTPPADAVTVVPTTFDTLNSWANGNANHVSAHHAVRRTWRTDPVRLQRRSQSAISQAERVADAFEWSSVMTRIPISLKHLLEIRAMMPT